MHVNMDVLPQPLGPEIKLNFLLNLTSIVPNWRMFFACKLSMCEVDIFVLQGNLVPSCKAAWSI